MKIIYPIESSLTIPLDIRSLNLMDNKSRNFSIEIIEIRNLLDMKDKTSCCEGIRTQVTEPITKLSLLNRNFVSGIGRVICIFVSEEFSVQVSLYCIFIFKKKVSFSKQFLCKILQKRMLDEPAST
ncbi:hypothetical protein P5V15_003559 [Pogonomyrmex californicus]